MEPPVELREGRKVCILLPWYKEIHPLTAFTTMGLIDRTRTKIAMRFGDAFVIHTRNQLVDDFLRSDCEWSLWVDSDMVLPFGNAGWYNSFTNFGLPEPFAGLHTIDRLLSHGKTLVSGTYWGRWNSGLPIFAEAMTNRGQAEKLRKPIDEIRPTKWTGFGCVLVHRSVYLDIEKTFPHLARGANGKDFSGFTPDGGDLSASHAEAIEILEDLTLTSELRASRVAQLLRSAMKSSARAGGLGMGEDVAFCSRALKSGHQPYIDLGLVCGHIGSHVFGPTNKIPK